MRFADQPSLSARGFSLAGSLPGELALLCILPFVVVPIPAFSDDVFSTPKRALLGLGALALLGWRLVRRAPGAEGPRLRLYREDALFAAALLAAALSAATSAAPAAQAPWLLLAAALAGALILGRGQRPGALALALLAAGSVEALITLSQAAGLDPLATPVTELFVGKWRHYGTLGNPNRVAWFLSLSLVAGITWFGTLSGRARAWAAAALALLAAGLAATLSRGSALALPLALGALAVASPRGDRRALARQALGAGVLALAALIAGWLLLPARFAHYLSNGASIVGRIQAWQDGLRLFLEHPWLGLGIGEFSRQAALSGAARAQPAFRVEYAHGEWLGILIEQGVAGFALLAAALATLLSRALRAYRRGERSLSVPLAIVFQVLFLSFYDFPLREPAVLLPFCVALAGLREAPGGSPQEIPLMRAGFRPAKKLASLMALLGLAYLGFAAFVRPVLDDPRTLHQRAGGNAILRQVLTH